MKHAVHDVPPAGGYGTLEGTTSGQWGGYYETSSDNGDSTYDDANATLDVPSCSETTGGSDEQTVAWVGMDGAGGSSDVFQAGVACTPGASTSNKIDNATYPYQFWWQDYNSTAPFFFTSLIPSAGDTIYIDVNAQAPSIYIEDETDNDYSISTSVSISNFSGDSVEWVMEGYGGNWADFSTVDFNDPAFEYVGGGGGNFSLFNYWAVEGEDSGFTVVAGPSSAQSGPPDWFSVSY
ncbi:MAG TPA: G1 family glutamic endopeptidase, partial [Chloroflexota bacterium]|nr:G1 family glutamic endopeptidase [Chloroflexota bacterium]